MYLHHIKNIIATAALAVVVFFSAFDAEAKLPLTIAVLPVTGDGQPEDLRELRVTFFNHIGSKNYTDTEINEVDNKVYLAEQKSGKKWQDFTTKELGELLGVEGLVYVNVIGVDKIYAGIYGALTVRMRVKLVESETGAVLWEKEDKVVKQSGSIPLSPWAAISTAVSSAMVLRDSVKIGLFDELCRSLAKEMPEPVNLLKVRPPTIFSVVTNALDSPFKGQTEILVSLKGDEGMDAFFTIGNVKNGITLQETGNGNYLGKYIVSDGDNWQNQMITVVLSNAAKKKETRYQVPYLVTADTTPPGQPAKFETSIIEKGMKLSWEKPNDEDIKEFVIQRASVGQTEFTEAALTPLNEYIDEKITAGQKIYYRVYTRDKAGNLSKPVEMSKVLAKPGPTNITGELKEDTVFYSYSSPYIIGSSLKVPKGVTLSIEDGTVIRFEDKASMLVEGSLKANGTKSGGITFKGKQYVISITDAGAGGALFSHSFLKNGDVLDISNSTAEFIDSKVESFDAGIKVSSGSVIKAENSKFSYNKSAVNIVSGTLEAKNCEFSGNSEAIVLGQDSNALLGDLAMLNNIISISTLKPLSINSINVGDRQSFETIKSFRGPVDAGKILPAGKTLAKLKEDSANDLSTQIGDTLMNEKYDEADKLMSIMKDIFPSRYAQMSPMHSYILYQLGRQTESKQILDESTASYKDAVSKMLGFVPAEGSHRELKFVKVRIPVLGTGEGIGKLAVSRAVKQAVKAFIEDAAGELEREKSYTVNDKIMPQADKYSENAYPIFTNVSGSFFDGFYAVSIMPSMIMADLTDLRIIGNQGRNLRIGVVSCGAEDNIRPLMVKELSSQMFPVTEHAAKGCIFGEYREELRSSADLLMIIKEGFSTSESRVSKNLKMINADLSVSIFDIKTGTQVFDISKGNAAYHMNESMGKKSAITNAYDSISKNVVSRVNELDKAAAPKTTETVVTAGFGKKPAKAKETEKTVQSDSAAEIIVTVAGVEPVFANMPDEFSEKPFITMSVENKTLTNISKAEVTLDIPGFMTEPVSAVIESIPSESKVRVRLYAVFSDDVAKMKANTTKDASITIKYNGKTVKSAYPVSIFEPHAVRWNTGEKIALFIDGSDPVIKQIAADITEKAEKAAVDQKYIKLYQGLYAFEYLSAYGISFNKNRESEFKNAFTNPAKTDVSSFPTEVLSKKSGGFDEIYALFASVLSACGIDTAFALIDGRFVALFDTSIPEELMVLAGDKKQKAVVYDENIWIPLELSLISSGTIEAWNSGAKSAASIGETTVLTSTAKATASYKNGGRFRTAVKPVPSEAYLIRFARINEYILAK